MKTKKVKMLVGVMVIILCTVNWMYLTPDKIKWGSLFNQFPIVKYKVNPQMIGFNTGDKESIIDNIRKASDIWSFQSGDSHFQFSYKGTTTNTPLSYDDISCTEEGKEILREKDNLVFASNTEDGDCSGQVCTFIWSCTDRNEILHFDTQINATGYEWDTGTNHKKSFNLATVLANQFGKILGLDHCSLGLTEDLCSLEVMGRGTSNPDKNSLLYKFIEPELIRNTLSLDDKTGLQSLYGNITPKEVSMKSEMNSFYPLADSICNPNPCVIPEEDSSKYQLSADEVLARSEYLTKIKAAGKVPFDEIVKTKMLIYQTMYENAYSQTKIPAERYLANAIHKRLGYIQQTENESLDASLKILSIQIQDRDSFLKKFHTEISNEYKKFSEAELKVLIQIRREMKNEKLKR